MKELAKVAKFRQICSHCLLEVVKARIFGSNFIFSNFLRQFFAPALK